MKAIEHLGATIWAAIDWMSIKLTGLSITVCFISPNAIIAWMGGIAAFTTIVYNGIRIYKELKTK